MSTQVTSGYTSEELFHFVGINSPRDDKKNYRTLCKVLQSKRVSYPPHDNNNMEIKHTVNWDQRLENEKFVVPYVTCFADIPFEELSVHTSKYGRFGIALNKNLLVRYGARPVMYIPTHYDDNLSAGGKTLLRDIETVIKGFKHQLIDKQEYREETSRVFGKEPDSTEDAVDALETIVFREFLAFIKPYNSQLTFDDPDNFYMEREWRRFGNTSFEPEHLTRLVVAKSYVDRAKQDFPEFQDQICGI